MNILYVYYHNFYEYTSIIIYFFDGKKHPGSTKKYNSGGCYEFQRTKDVFIAQLQDAPGATQAAAAFSSQR